MTFPEESKRCKTVCILKAPKTESSIRKVFLSKSVPLMLVDWKAKQDEVQEILGEDDEVMIEKMTIKRRKGILC